MFRERVDRVDAEVMILETEWLARNDEHVTALRAELYVMVRRGAQRLDAIRPKIDNIISAAVDVACEIEYDITPD